MNKYQKKEKELKELEKVYAGLRRRSKTEDKKNLRREISKMKTKRRKYKKILKEDKKYIKITSLIFKRKTYKTAMNKFNELYDKKKTCQKK